MTADEVRELFRYNTWASRRVFDVAAQLPPEHYAKDLGSSFGGIHGTLAHITAAERVWLDRWLGQPGKLLGPADFAGLPAVVALWEAVEAERTPFLDSLDDRRLEDPITARSSGGGTYVNTLRETVLHVVEHSSYHRGQVITLLRQLGHTPPPPSYNLMGYFRERARRAN